MQKTKYVTNKQLLAEIHKCKSSFCTFTSPEYADFDVIVSDLAEITPNYMEEIAAKKSAKITPKGEEPVAVPVDGLVVRYMTFDHIPLDPTAKRKKRTNPDHAKTNFPPFKHFVYQGGDLVEVGRSHWDGDFETGHFTAEKGKLSNRMGSMILTLTERYGRRVNWRGYTYLDEMRSYANQHLCQIALQFDESKSDNPFAFYTTSMKNCFRRILLIERKNQNLRDDLLMQAGMAPSYTRQIENELAQRPEFQAASKPLPAKRGRKSAAEQAAIAKADAEADPMLN